MVPFQAAHFIHWCILMASDMEAFELSTENELDWSFPSLAQRMWRPWILKRMSNLDLSDHRAVFHMFTCGFFYPSERCKQHLWRAWRTVFTDSDFCKHPWAHAVMFMTQSWLFFKCRAWWSQAILYWFLTLSLANRDFSRFSESFDNIIYCSWSDLHSF